MPNYAYCTQLYIAFYHLSAHCFVFFSLRLFWFTLTALIVLFLAAAVNWEFSQQKEVVNDPLENIAEHLVADVFHSGDCEDQKQS